MVISFLVSDRGQPAIGLGRRNGPQSREPPIAQDRIPIRERLAKEGRGSVGTWTDILEGIEHQEARFPAPPGILRVFPEIDEGGGRERRVSLRSQGPSGTQPNVRRAIIGARGSSQNACERGRSVAVHRCESDRRLPPDGLGRILQSHRQRRYGAAFADSSQGPGRRRPHVRIVIGDEDGQARFRGFAVAPQRFRQLLS